MTPDLARDQERRALGGCAAAGFVVALGLDAVQAFGVFSGFPEDNPWKIPILILVLLVPVASPEAEPAYESGRRLCRG